MPLSTAVHSLTATVVHFQCRSMSASVGLWAVSFSERVTLELTETDVGVMSLCSGLKLRIAPGVFSSDRLTCAQGYRKALPGEGLITSFKAFDISDVANVPNENIVVQMEGTLVDQLILEISREDAVSRVVGENIHSGHRLA